jgi:hypothetical protein
MIATCLAVVAVAVAPPPDAEAAACGSLPIDNIGQIRTAGVSCSTARRLAPKILFRSGWNGSNPLRVEGFYCSNTVVAYEASRVSCRAGRKSFSFLFTP